MLCHPFSLVYLLVALKIKVFCRADESIQIIFFPQLGQLSLAPCSARLIFTPNLKHGEFAVWALVVCTCNPCVLVSGKFLIDFYPSIVKKMLCILRARSLIRRALRFAGKPFMKNHCIFLRGGELD